MTQGTSAALSAVPRGLREPLLAEHREIVQNFLERRWLPSELRGGRFSEIVYTILDGRGAGTYAPRPLKPPNFRDACLKLERYTNVPRSFQILIPRLLPPLYEVRNNRSVGHVGGDVDPNHMDSAAVLAICSWVMCELVRVYHGLSTAAAQDLVDSLAEARIPLIWSGGGAKRVLDPKLRLPAQLLLLVGTTAAGASVDDLAAWTECRDRKHLLRTIRALHKRRLVEFSSGDGSVRVLPPGAAEVQRLVRGAGGSAGI